MSSAAGLPFLHWDAGQAVRVLYIDGEMPRRVMKERLADAVHRLGLTANPPANMHLLSHEDIPDGVWQPLNTAKGQAVIEQQIERIGGVGLVMFDNVMSLVAGDQREEVGWTQVLPWIRSLTRRGIAQLWLNHTGLDTTRAYGTKTREWQMDNVIHLDRIERDDTDVSFELKFTKARERTPLTRDDFRDMTVALINNEWRWEAQLAGGAKLVPMSPNGAKFYEALCAATAASGKKYNSSPAASFDEWKVQCQRMGLIDYSEKEKAHSARSLLSKYRLELISRNWIACNDAGSGGGTVWTLGPNSLATPF
jgi:hypothetical protein